MDSEIAINGGVLAVNEHKYWDSYIDMGVLLPLILYKMKDAP